MHENALINLITGILENSMKFLMKIEKNLENKNRLLKSLYNKIENFQTKISNDIDNFIKTGLEKTYNNILYQFELINIKKLQEINKELDQIFNKLSLNFQMKNIELLNKNIELSLYQPKPSIEKKEDLTRKNYKPAPKQRPISYPPTSIPKTQSIESEIPEGDWTESELEGAKIFDTIIVGWKRRDFEKAQGTKEIFMRAWKKLSNYDRAQIKNGAWSKKLIDKIKLLGRA